MCVPITLDVEKGACTGGSKTVGFHYVRIVGGDCWNVSFIQWSDVGTDLWKSRECGYGECQKYFSFLQSRIHLSHYMMMDRAS